jgi:hypothetical protein
VNEEVDERATALIDSARCPASTGLLCWTCRADSLHQRGTVIVDSAQQPQDGPHRQSPERTKGAAFGQQRNRRSG